MLARHRLPRAKHRRRAAPWLALLLLGAGPIIACSLIPADERTQITIPEDVPGLILVTPGERDSFQSPSWSPDGRSLAYDRANAPLPSGRGGFPADADIYTMDLATGDSRQLTDNELPDLEPDWSPHGREILFVRSPEVTGYPSRLLLMLISVDGLNERVLLECPGPCLHPKWSPDGEQIAFAMEEGIWIIRRDGSELRRVSGEKVTAATYPNWSPDGGRLVYWASTEVTSVFQAQHADLAFLDLSTGEETIVLSGVYPLNPDWSPLGSPILYSDRPTSDNARTLFAFDPERAVGMRLIERELDYNIFDAVWSPDGRRISFAYGLEQIWSNLYILDLAESAAPPPDPSAGP